MAISAVGRPELMRRVRQASIASWKGAWMLARRAAQRRERRGPRRCAFGAPPRQTQTTDRLQGCDLRRDRRGSGTVLYLQDSPQQPGCDQSRSSAPPRSDPRMEVLLQDGLEDIVITPPTDLTRVSIHVLKRLESCTFAMVRRAPKRGTVINVPRVVGRASSVGWPHSGLRIKGDRQFDGAGVPAVRQPGRLAFVARVSDAPG